MDLINARVATLNLSFTGESKLSGVALKRMVCWSPSGDRSLLAESTMSALCFSSCALAAQRMHEIASDFHVIFSMLLGQWTLGDNVLYVEAIYGWFVKACWVKEMPRLDVRNSANT